VKIKNILENTYARNAAALRGWENSRPEYPPEWDNEEMDPSDHGFESFAEVWSDVQQLLANGNNLPAISQAVGTHPQQLFAKFRKEKRIAVGIARENFSNEDLDDIYYSEDVMGVIRVLKQLATNPSQDQNQNIQQLEKAMAELTDDNNMFDYDGAERLVQDKYSDY